MESAACSPVVELAAELVDSGCAEAPWDTRRASRVLETELRDEFKLELLEPEPGHRSVLASYDFGRPGRTLLLCGHLDVVPAEAAGGWTKQPFRATVEDGRLYGRGSCDMKGAVAALVVAAKRSIAAAESLSGRLVLAAVADEESGGRRGAGAVVAAGRASADGVLIAEPSDGGICTSHRGMCFVEVTTHGRAGHASMPDRADNAVELMVDVLSALRSLQLTYDAAETAMTPGFALGTMISGGTKANVIPDRCRAVVDVRKVTGMTDRSVLDDIRSHLDRCEIDLERVELVIEASGESAECDPEAPVVIAARAAARRQAGTETPLTHFPAATDAFWFANHAEAPTIAAFGPGNLAGCHVVDESVSIQELEDYARIYQDFIETFLATDS